jgi:GTPase
VRIDQREFVIADIPGLIEGAHEGVGLGDRFLAHVERAGALLHLVDATGEDAVAAWKTVRRELEAYGHGLAERPEILALTKIDALTPKAIAEQKKKLKRASKQEPLLLSSHSGEGVETVLRALLKTIAKTRKELEPEKEEAWRP